MHAPVHHLERSEFMFREPAALQVSSRSRGLLCALKRGIATARQRLRNAHELASITSDQWSVGDYGISRWQAEQPPRAF